MVSDAAVKPEHSEDDQQGWLQYTVLKIMELERTISQAVLKGSFELEVQVIVVLAAGIEHGSACWAEKSRRHVLLDCELPATSSAKDRLRAIFRSLPPSRDVVRESFMTLVTRIIAVATPKSHGDDVAGARIVSAPRHVIHVNAMYERRVNQSGLHPSDEQLWKELRG